MDIVVGIRFIHVACIALFGEHQQWIKCLVKLKVMRRGQGFCDEMARFVRHFDGGDTGFAALQALTCYRISWVELDKDRVRVMNNQPFWTRLKVMIFSCQIIYYLIFINE